MLGYLKRDIWYMLCNRVHENGLKKRGCGECRRVRMVSWVTTETLGGLGTALGREESEIISKVNEIPMIDK